MADLLLRSNSFVCSPISDFTINNANDTDVLKTKLKEPGQILK